MIFSIIGCKENKLKKIEEEELINRIVNNKMPDPTTVNIVTINGSEIHIDSFITLEQTGKYFVDYLVDDRGEIMQIVVREQTEDDKRLINKINRRLNEGPEVQFVDVNCSNKEDLLQKVFDRDQKMRQGESDIDPEIDHENLEIIVSFLEKCGMPTLQEVNHEQINGIWLVLQHAPAKYQSRYIPLLEEAAKNGDLTWGTIALMRDRALMYEGKPQIYGSQISNGELYDLFEPEYVDQRRKEVGMGSLKEYLMRFNVEFNVEQKVK